MASVSQLLCEARRAGLTIRPTPEGDKLYVGGPGTARPYVAQIAARKVEILAALNGPSEGTIKAALDVGLPPDWHQLWDERAAIREFDGGFSREVAEFYALKDVICLMQEQARATATFTQTKQG